MHEAQNWADNLHGNTSLAARQWLLHKMITGWRRRGKKMLEVNCSSGFFLEELWQAGFDVSGSAKDQTSLNQTRERLGNRAVTGIASAELLPFEDSSFDYAICFDGLETAPDLGAVLSELVRVATRGVMLGFNNSFSVHGAGCAIHKKAMPHLPGGCTSLNPFKVWKALRKEITLGQCRWGSCLPGPVWSWGSSNRLLNQVFTGLNFTAMPVPVGSFAILRLDLAPPYAGIHIPLLYDGKELKEQALAGSMGRSYKNSSKD